MAPNDTFELISISYAKQVFEAGSREQVRMLQYADRLAAYHMIVFTRRSDGYHKPLTLGKLTVYPTNVRTRLGMLLAAYRIGRALTRERLSATDSLVVSAQDPFETSLIARLITRGTQAQRHVQVHGDVLNPRHLGSSLLAQVRRVYARHVLKTTQCIRVVSERIKRSVMALGVPEERINVLPIQAALDTFLAVGRERLYREKDAANLLYVGRFAPEKNLPLLLRAVASARNQGAAVTLRLIGAGPEESQVRTLIVQLGLEKIVHVSPWQKDVCQSFKEADILVLASLHEGWGMVIVEAMAAGLPVITTDVGCAGELMRDGDHGRTVPVGDEEAFTQAIIDLTENAERRAACGRAAHHAATVWILPEEKYLSRWAASFHCTLGT